MADTLLKGGEFLIATTEAQDVFTPEDFSDEQKQFGETTEQFVTNELVPKIEEIDNLVFRLFKIRCHYVLLIDPNHLRSGKGRAIRSVLKRLPNHI